MDQHWWRWLAVACLFFTVGCIPEPTPPVERPDGLEPVQVAEAEPEREAEAVTARQAEPRSTSLGKAVLGLTSMAAHSLLQSQLDRASTSPDRGPPVLTIVVSGNARGEMQICDCKVPIGGLARRSAAIDLLRQSEDVLYLDAGDSLSDVVAAPPRRANAPAEVKAKAFLEAMGRMQPDAMLVGLRDLRLELKTLQKTAEDAGVPLLSANLATSDDKSMPFPGFRVVEKNGVKVGIVGLTPRHRRDPRFLGQLGLELVPNNDALVDAMTALEKENVSLRVLLSGLGISETQRLLNRWPDEAPKPHLVVVSGTARLTREPRWQSDVPMIEAGDRARQLLLLRVWEQDGVPALALADRQTQRRQLAALTRALGDLSRAFGPREGRPQMQANPLALLKTVRTNEGALEVIGVPFASGIELEVLELAEGMPADPAVLEIVRQVESPPGDSAPR